MDISAIVQEEMKTYAVKGLNSQSYFLANPSENIYSVLTMAIVKGQSIVNTDLLVEIVDNIIVIRQDLNNKPLVEALASREIPREAVVLAYLGEGVHDAG